MHKLRHMHFDRGILVKFIELLYFENTSAQKCFSCFRYTSPSTNEDSRSRYTFEKRFLEQQHTRSKFERPLCVVFSKQRNSLSLSQNLDILLLISRRNVSFLFEEMSNILEPSAKRLKLAVK